MHLKKVEKDQLQKLSNNILKEILEGRGSDIDFTEIWQNPSDEHQNFITFVKNFKPDSKGLKYQLKVKPLELLPEAFVLNKLIENNPSCNEIPPKMYRMFPQSTSLIPDHLRLDTLAMINLFKPQVQGYNRKHLSENINLFKNQIWSQYLNLDHKYLNTFKKMYSFGHQITTNGESISLMMTRNDLLFKPYSAKSPEEKEEYVEDLHPEKLEDLKNKKSRGGGP
ncbi:hypothetical protein GEMRC1_006946 [Eukaryota sp. GEM-RC1]